MISLSDALAKGVRFPAFSLPHPFYVSGSLKLRLPHSEGDGVDPLVISLAAAVHVELELHAHIVGPAVVCGMSRRIDRCAVAIDDQRDVSVGVGAGIGGYVPLNVMPRVGGERRTGDRSRVPVAAGRIPGVPLSVAMVALASHHVGIATHELEHVVLLRLGAMLRIVVEVDIEVPKEITDAVIGSQLQPPESASHTPELKNSVLSPSRDGELWFCAIQ